MSVSSYLYRQVYDDIRRRIDDGEWSLGDRLPNETQLTEHYHVSAITVKRALDMLRDDGFVIRRPGVGTVLHQTSPREKTVIPASAPALLGCVVTSFDDTFGTRVIEGMLDEAADSHLIVKRSAGRSELEEKHLAGLVDVGAKGIILHPASSDFIPPTVLRLIARRLPIVILDRVFDGVPVSSVSSDNVAGAQEATSYLFSRGHERVAFIGSPSGVSSMRDRRRGFAAAHAAHHVVLRESDIFLRVRSTIPSASVSVDEDIAGLREFLRAHRDITACVVAEYNEAVLVREACRLEGLDVPGDLSIVCFDHPEAESDKGLFRFTHVRQDQRGMGRTAVRTLLTLLEQPDDIQIVELPTSIVEGDSVRAR